ncbi:hypothetical protein IX339_001813 [Porphyromonas levii]|uniref:neutral zinc metallopeptidase n=1 Tax=Porphyromonas levii TaxID=28114 RepID=UPI002011E281|nr:neutral zinc metallopeptidase [Porphyromonas levii]MBR8732344.1 hypothetical protein [Porphyromonas levii]
MKLDGRRESSNVEDRRGKGVKRASMGIGGLIIVGLITWFMGGNPLDVLKEGAGEIIQGQQGTTQEYMPTAEEEELARLVKVVLAGTEDETVAHSSLDVFD